MESVPYQIPTNFEEVGKDAVGDELMREETTKLWSTEDLLVQDDMELVVWHYRLNHCSFKTFLRLSKRRIIPKNIRRVRTPPNCVACMFGKSYKRPCRTKGKISGGSTRKPSETRTGATTLIYQMIYAQPGLITQVTGALNHAIFWADTVFVDHYSN